MSNRVLNWVFEESPATGNDRLVLIAIADEADDDGTNAFPSVDRIARKARVPKRTTLRCLQRLEEAGELVVTRPEKRGRGHFNTYAVVMNGATLTPEERARNGATEGEKRRATARGATQSVPDPQTPGSKDPDPHTPPSLPLAVPDPFDEFWATYPRKADKPAARRAWPRAIAKETPATIVAAAARYRDDPNRLDGFTKHPTTWLNNECWADGPLPSRTGRQTNTDLSRAAISRILPTDDRIEITG